MMRKVFRDFKMETFVNKKFVIPITIGIAIIIVGIILINNQESETQKNDDEIEIEDFNPEDQIIDEKLDDIEKKANENYFESAPRIWQTSGPFQIDRAEYHIGEKVFLRIGGLDENEKGQIAFLKQSNETHYKVYQTIPFDGNNKAAFNYYVDIKLLKGLGLCSVEDITGEWTVVFRGTEYENLNFKIIDKFIPGEEDAFESLSC